jgi:hypothetical protein
MGIFPPQQFRGLVNNWKFHNIGGVKRTTNKKSTDKRASTRTRSGETDRGSDAISPKALDSLDRFGMKYNAVLDRLAKR